MFEIINRETGRRIGVTDEPPYVRMGKNGSWQGCAEDGAEAVSVKGTKYSLDGRAPVMLPTYDDDGNETGEEAAPVAVVSVVDGGELVFETSEDVSANEQHISDIENALCELAIQFAAAQK